jgi:hypothetical protein
MFKVTILPLLQPVSSSAIRIPKSEIESPLSKRRLRFPFQLFFKPLVAR